MFVGRRAPSLAWRWRVMSSSRARRVFSTAPLDDDPEMLPSPYGGGGVRAASPVYPAPAHGPLATADAYVASLRGRGLNVYLMGDNVEEFVDNPIIAPSINVSKSLEKSQSQYNYPPGYRIQRKLREQTPSNLRLCASLTSDACLTRRAGPL